jgi:hypothetical protein
MDFYDTKSVALGKLTVANYLRLPTGFPNTVVNPSDVGTREAVTDVTP